jgi:hypothetical protein
MTAYLAFVANDGTNRLLISSSANGQTWNPGTEVNQFSKLAPALAVWQNKLWLAFVADNGTNDLLVCSSANGQAWSPSTVVTDQFAKQFTKMAPALAVWDNKLWLAFVADNDSNDLVICSTADGKTWSPTALVANQASKMAPALAWL